MALGRKSYLGSAESYLPFFFALVGVRGMNEGILFQRLHHKNTKFCTKNPILSFLVVSTRKSQKIILYSKIREKLNVMK